MQAKRLYEMGGDVTAQFYPSNFSGSTMLSDGKRPSKAAKKYNKKHMPKIACHKRNC